MHFILTQKKNRDAQRRLKVTCDSILLPTNDFISFQLSHPVFNRSLPFHPVPLLLFHSITIRVSNPCTCNPSTSCSSTLTEYHVTLFYLNRLKLVTEKDAFEKYKSVSKSTWSTFEHESQEHSAQNCKPVIKPMIGILFSLRQTGILAVVPAGPGAHPVLQLRIQEKMHRTSLFLLFRSLLGIRWH